jgi:sigma-B regulation protein RsbU (phosphoserine phosphatase)
MTRGDLEHFRSLLTERQENLNDWLESFASGEDEIRKVRALLSEIDGALKRAESGAFGECVICKGEVELNRLEVQPVRQVCLACITDEERRTLEHELTVASRIHRALLPQAYEKIDGYEIGVKSIAAGQIGGDYYDFLRAQDGSGSRIVIGDTMGKGLPAGLLMANLQGALRIYSEQIDSPAELTRRLNQWLCRNIPIIKFVSLFCARVNNGGQKSSITYSNAGHPSPIIVRQDGSVESLESNGGVLGVHEKFEFHEKTVPFNTGDLLVLYTDGITETENFHGSMFGEERLIEYIKNRREEPLDIFIDVLISELQSFSEKPDLEDDTTVIALRKTS